MGNYITLLGAEQVERASHTMSSAAEGMLRAVSILDESLRSSLDRFEELVRRLEALKEPADV